MFSKSITSWRHCPFCGVYSAATLHLRVDRNENPSAWACARRGALNEQLCSNGHHFVTTHPATILRDIYTSRVLLVTPAQSEHWQLALGALDGAASHEMPRHFEVIRPQDLIPALQSLECDIALGNKDSISFTSDLLNMSWLLEHPELLAQGVLKPPNQNNAQPMRELCVHLISSTPMLHPRMRAHLYTQTGRCNLLLREYRQACLDLKQALNLLANVGNDCASDIAILKVDLAEALLADGSASTPAALRAVELLDAAEALCNSDDNTDADRAGFILLQTQAQLLATPTIKSPLARRLTERLLNCHRKVPQNEIAWHTAANAALETLAGALPEPAAPANPGDLRDLMEKLQDEGRWRELAELAGRLLVDEYVGVSKRYLLILRANGLVRQSSPTNNELLEVLQLTEDGYALTHATTPEDPDDVREFHQSARDILTGCFKVLENPGMERQDAHAGFGRTTSVLVEPPQIALLVQLHLEVACDLIAEQHTEPAWRALVRANQLAFQSFDGSPTPACLALNQLISYFRGVDGPPIHGYRQLHDKQFYELTAPARREFFAIHDQVLNAAEQADLIPLAARLVAASMPYFRWTAQEERDADGMVTRLGHLAKLLCDCEDECAALRALNEAEVFVKMGLVPEHRLLPLLITRAGAMVALQQYQRAERILLDTLANAPSGVAVLNALQLQAIVQINLYKFEDARATLFRMSIPHNQSESGHVVHAMLTSACEGYAALAANHQEQACLHFDRALEVAMTSAIPLGMYCNVLNARVELMLKRDELDEAHYLVDVFRPILQGEGNFGDRCPHLRATLLGVAAKVAIAGGRLSQAFNLLRSASELDRRHCANRLAAGLSADRRQLLREYRNRAEMLAGLVAQHLGKDESAVAYASEAVGRFKAINLQVERLRLAVIRSVCAQNDDKNGSWQRLNRLREQLGAAVVRGDSGLKSLMDELDNNELDITASSQLAFAIEEAMHEFNLAATRQQNANAPIIDVIRCEAFFDSPSYLAFLIAPDQPVKVIVLGECASVDAMVKKFLNGLQSQSDSYTTSLINRFTPNAGSALRALLVDPWNELLAPFEHIVWCLDSALSKVPLECLPDVNGRPLLTRHSFSYVSAPQRLSLSGIIGFSSSSQGGPIVIGDPYFDEGTNAAFHCSPLPGARNEAHDIARRLATDAYFGRDAKKRLLLGSPSPSIFHVATHGYILSQYEGSDAHPLLGAGLLFAGANSANRVQSEAGILSAEEALAADMGATSLTVLSACQTAAGFQGGEENLAGLAHAFEAAGTQSLLVGLWRVPDEPTRMLMSIFYEKLQCGCSSAKALREAKLAVREKYTTFGAWGAFILIGNWGPITVPGGS